MEKSVGVRVPSLALEEAAFFIKPFDDEEFLTAVRLALCACDVDLEWLSSTIEMNFRLDLMTKIVYSKILPDRHANFLD